jgi:hypothetical protein
LSQLEQVGIAAELDGSAGEEVTGILLCDLPAGTAGLEVVVELGVGRGKAALDVGTRKELDDVRLGAR